jgi:hypothetical protein
MESIHQIETLYSFVAAFHKNPRISVRELHKNFSHYRNRRSTTKLLREAFDKKMIIGPRIWCNSGIDVKILKNIDDPLVLLQEYQNDESITYMTALLGDFSFFYLKKGASILQYAETICPSYPPKRRIKEINLKRKGKLVSDKYPMGWDDLDWGVFETMRDPFYSYVKAGNNLGVSWHTVKNRFEKIFNDCKTWILMLPKGYEYYQQCYAIFKTEYEIDLRNQLQELDRTSIIYKFEDKILLHTFLDETLDNLIFYELKRKGLISDLCLAVPLGWHSKYW